MDEDLRKAIAWLENAIETAKDKSRILITDKTIQSLLYVLKNDVVPKEPVTPKVVKFPEIEPEDMPEFLNRVAAMHKDEEGQEIMMKLAQCSLYIHMCNKMLKKKGE